jgi:hypothetical protein
MQKNTFLMQGLKKSSIFACNLFCASFNIDLFSSPLSPMKTVSTMCPQSQSNNFRTRVARWYVFKRKMQIWVNFGGPWNEKILEYSMSIWNILRPFGIVYGHLVI